MSTTRVQWFRAVTATIAAEVILVVAAVLWVAFYSYVIDPGQPVAVYRQHAQVSGPYVSIVAGVVVFSALGRWWIGSLRTALAWIILYLAVDAAILWAVSGTAPALPWTLVVASYATKAVCGLLAARRAEHAATA
jgi:hypothetical protein